MFAQLLGPIAANIAATLWSFLPSAAAFAIAFTALSLSLIHI